MATRAYSDTVILSLRSTKIIADLLKGIIDRHNDDFEDQDHDDMKAVFELLNKQFDGISYYNKATRLGYYEILSETYKDLIPQ